MEKNQQELREILARDREEHREQIAQMMQIIIRPSHEKGVVDDTDSVNATTRDRGVIEGPSFPLLVSLYLKWEFFLTQFHRW